MSLAEDLAGLNKSIKANKIDGYTPYPWQQEFHAAGADNPERLLMAANRTGKTFCGAAEITYHAMGKYPDWWEGKRSTAPCLVWCATITNEMSRDVQQKELLGDPQGTGSLPESALGKVTYRQAGVANVADTVKVKHVAGGESTIIFKTYDQGWRKFQGAAPFIVWLDEEPDANSIKENKIYTECLTRILTTHGSILSTLTPLLGETELVRHFTQSDTRGVYIKSATWADAPHIDPVEAARMLESFPDFERDARSKGVPMLGTGRVFMINEEEIKCDPFEIPAHYFRICGVDFGIDHPAAGAWIAHDRDTDTIYVTDGYRKANETAVYHASAINKRGHWMPVAWPHDGLARGKADGVPLRKQYKIEGANMLGKSARYKEDTGGGQPVEPIVLEIMERMRTGRFKVFANLSDWFEEFRALHRDDNGKIVAVRDDLLKATFYAVMMRRYARQSKPRKRRQTQQRSLR